MADPAFACTLCTAKYTEKKNLNRHVRKHHPLYTQELIPNSNRTVKNQLKCPGCTAKYTEKKNLNRHVRKHHPLYIQELTPNSNGTVKNQLKCPGCEAKALNMKELLNHVSQMHDIDIDTSDMIFHSATEFESWLKLEEKTNSCSFRCRTSRKGFKKYQCHRSGSYKTLDVLQRKRQLKQMGSCKINGTCTAYISLKEVDGILNVHYCRTHFGHTCDLGHLRLSKDEKNVIAEKLIQGIPGRRILRDIQAREPNEKLQRRHISNSKDILNVSQQFGLHLSSGKMMHQQDVLSVEAWVSAEKSGRVLFYKAQGSVHQNLEDDDFMLVIQTSFQKDMLKNFGHDRICIDSTHGTNAYDFNLTSLLIVDEMEQGCPVAFCLSTRVNHDTMKLFFKAVMENNGKKDQVNVFMSDDAPVFKNAWTEVMGRPAKVLLCAWHVDRAWKGKLKTIRDEELRKEAYRELKVAASQLDEIAFIAMFAKLLEKFISNSETFEFGQYLKSYYSKRPEQWASCYRLNANINTNMYVEAFHKTFKYYYQEGKKNKRVDLCINALIEFVDDFAEKKTQEVHRGKSTKKTAGVLPNHQKGHAMFENVTKCVNAFWKVENNVIVRQREIFWKISVEKCEKTFTITKNGNHKICSKRCGVKCPDCKICRDTYFCTCVDRAIKGLFCKHIHAVCIKFPQVMQKDVELPAAPAETFPAEAPTAPVEEAIQKRLLEKGEEMRQIDSLLPSLSLSVEVLKGMEALKDAYIKMANLNGYEHSKLQPKTKEPANKKITQQVRFKTVRKNRRKPNYLKKANAAEELSTSELILHGQTLNVLRRTGAEHNY